MGSLFGPIREVGQFMGYVTVKIGDHWMNVWDGTKGMLAGNTLARVVPCPDFDANSLPDDLRFGPPVNFPPRHAIMTPTSDVRAVGDLRAPLRQRHTDASSAAGHRSAPSQQPPE
eukprot:5775734-Pyramimonas_sp.AAC.1